MPLRKVVKVLRSSSECVHIINISFTDCSSATICMVGKGHVLRSFKASVSSWDRKRLAYKGAILVPIANPCLSLKEKLFLVRIITITINIYIAQISCEYDQMCVTNKYETN